MCGSITWTRALERGAGLRLGRCDALGLWPMALDERRNQRGVKRMDKPVEMGGVIVDAQVKARVVVIKTARALPSVRRGSIHDVWIEACHRS